MSSITRSTQSTRPDSIGSNEIPQSTSSTGQDGPSVQTVSQDPEAEAIVRRFRELGEKVIRPMDAKEREPELPAANKKEDGNENKPEN